jgi:septum site-determining protein MinD
MMDIDDMTDILNIDIIGVVPDDEQIVISTNKGEPAVSVVESMSGKAYRNITKRVIGETIPFLELEIQTGFMDRVMKMFSFKR